MRCRKSYNQKQLSSTPTPLGSPICSYPNTCISRGVYANFLGMNSLVILGAGRSGKSTLAKLVAEHHCCNIFHMDSAVDAFKIVMPEVGEGKPERTQQARTFLSTFFACYIKSDSERGNLVAEGSHLLLQDAAELQSERIKCVVVVNSELTVDKLFADIRQNDTEDDWTFYCDDKSLKQLSKKIVSKNQMFLKHAPKFGFEIIDTRNGREKSFEHFVNNLKFAHHAGATHERRKVLKNYVKERIN